MDRYETLLWMAAICKATREVAIEGNDAMDFAHFWGELQEDLHPDDVTYVQEHIVEILEG